MQAFTADTLGMSRKFVSQPGMANPLAEAVRNLDRALSHPGKSRMSKPIELPQAQSLLQEVERFHQQAQQHKDTSEFKMLLAAGCRLSSDLNEAVRSQLMDSAQSQDERILDLSRQLVRQLIARAQTAQLLKKAQTLRNHTVETAETAGLGVII